MVGEVRGGGEGGMAGEGGMKRGSEVGRWGCSLSDNPFSLFLLPLPPPPPLPPLPSSSGT